MRESRRYCAGDTTIFTSKVLILPADLRTQLSATDYGNFLANEPSPLSTTTISDKATQILVDQFNFIRSNAVEPLRQFLDYITSVVHCDFLNRTHPMITQLRLHDRQCRFVDHWNFA
jgi:hypothetical protein